MKGIKVVAANEAFFLKAAQKIDVFVIKLQKIKREGFVFYRLVAPFDQQDLFNLGTAYESLVRLM